MTYAGASLVIAAGSLVLWALTLLLLFHLQVWLIRFGCLLYYWPPPELTPPELTPLELTPLELKARPLTEGATDEETPA